MKLILMILVFVLLHKANAQIPGPGECTKAKDRYTELNNHLLVRRQGTSDVAPQSSLRRTQDLISYITRNILARLTDIKDVGAVRAYLTCMQQDDGEHPWDELTNTPQVFETTPGSVPLAFSTMLIMRGGDAIPDTLPLVQCFAQIGGKWTLIANGNEEGFNMHALYVDELKSPISDESWYLLSGKVNGQGGAVRMEVVACGASQMRTVWNRDGIKWGEVKVYGRNTVSITYEKQEDERTAAINGDKIGIEMYIEDDSGNRKRFSETLHVTPKGLEP